MANRVPITVRLESFEGPLDLLLYLIQSHEMDISKVSVSKVTDQFLTHVRLMQELNFDTASEFLVIAAMLLLWKSRALLPQDENAAVAANAGEVELTPEDLVRQLLEHQRFLEAGENLAQLPKLGDDVFARHNSKPPIEKVWKDMDITSLALGYQDLLVRERKRKQILRKETVSLTDKIQEFGQRLEVGAPTDMRTLMSTFPDKPEVVVTFLASLELSRLKKMRLHQQETYTPIYLELLESLLGFDFNLASGFDAPAPSPTPAPAQ